MSIRGRWRSSIHTNSDKYGKTGLKLLAGAGVIVIYSAAATAAAMGSGMAGGAATGGAVAVLSVIPVVAVVNITAVVVMNSKNKAKVVAEFDRRRLDLSLPIAPGETVSGSLFSPMTPGPQRLQLRGRSGGESVERVLELKPLGALHLQPARN
ncbi:MAG: hypothetical protein Q8J74_10990 [Candidatus Didemnitutus sp.]|nr:hypothetical protein [Candidatus Didemnitutus sp.]